VPSRHPQEWVIGDVLRLADPERVLRRLDIHEGCGPGAPRPPEYVRHIVPLRLEAGGDIDAWTYIYNWPLARFTRIRSGDFLRR